MEPADERRDADGLHPDRQRHAWWRANRDGASQRHGVSFPGVRRVRTCAAHRVECRGHESAVGAGGADRALDWPRVA